MTTRCERWVTVLYHIGKRKGIDFSRDLFKVKKRASAGKKGQSNSLVKVVVLSFAAVAPNLYRKEVRIQIQQRFLATGKVDRDHHKSYQKKPHWQCQPV